MSTGGARVTGITGPPVGKSTLISAMCVELRKADWEIGVLSVDLSSPFTQGAVLGDRIRLSDHFLDPAVFIRSMRRAARWAASPRPRFRQRS